MTDMPKKKTAAKGADLSSYRHEAATRVNNPTAEFQGLVDDKGEKLVWKRNTQLDPQLVWRGKDQEAGPLEVEAPPIYIQEKVQPRAIIDDLRRRSSKRKAAETNTPTFWSDFDFQEREEPTEFYSHEFPVKWSNRMILGDSLLVMAGLGQFPRPGSYKLT
jgi:adenine-specific DNA-methyltransferase